MTGDEGEAAPRSPALDADLEPLVGIVPQKLLESVAMVASLCGWQPRSVLASALEAGLNGSGPALTPAEVARLRRLLKGLDEGPAAGDPPSSGPVAS